MTAPRVRVMFIVLALAAMVGCHRSPTSPSAPSLAGTWVGTGFFQPVSTLSLQLTQSGSSLTGPWTSTQTLPPEFGGGTFPGPSGTMSGSVNGSNVSMTFTVSGAADCTFPVNVTATVNANQMTGTYSTVSVSCSLRLTGSITLTKQ